MEMELISITLTTNSTALLPWVVKRDGTPEFKLDYTIHPGTLTLTQFQGMVPSTRIEKTSIGIYYYTEEALYTFTPNTEKFSSMTTSYNGGIAGIHTARDISIGSSYGDVIAKYGQPSSSSVLMYQGQTIRDEVDISYSI